MQRDRAGFRQRLIARLGPSIAKPLRAYLGDPVTGLVTVPDGYTDTVGMVYVHGIPPQPFAVSMARNTVLLPHELIYGAPVELDVDPAGYRIRGKDAQFWDTYLDGLHVSDQRLITIDQITYGMLLPDSPNPSMRAIVTGAIYTVDGTRYSVATQYTQDFTSLIPATAGQAIAYQVEVDPTTGALSYTAGSSFNGAVAHDEALANNLYPMTITTPKFAKGWVVLLYGMTAINPGRNIYAAPEWLVKQTSNIGDILTSEGRILVDSNGDIITSG